MRVIFAIIVLALAANTALAQDLTTDKGKLSYAYGWQVGQTIMSRGDEFDTATMRLRGKCSAIHRVRDPHPQPRSRIAMPS